MERQLYTARHSEIVKLVIKEMRMHGCWTIENGCELRKEQRFPEALRRMGVTTSRVMPDIVALSIGEEGQKSVLIADVKVKWFDILHEAQDQVEEQYRELAGDVKEEVDLLGPVAVPVGATGEILDSWRSMCSVLRVPAERANEFALKVSAASIMGSQKCYNSYWQGFHSHGQKSGAESRRSSGK